MDTNNSLVDNDSLKVPDFFDLLSTPDKEGYYKLRDDVADKKNKFKRNTRISSLVKAIQKIRIYCERNDNYTWKRNLVCGICWIDQDIAINTHQLKLLVNKCKSSINGAISSLGYVTIAFKNVAPILVEHIPYLKGNFVQQRQWSLRRKVNLSPAPVIPHYLLSPQYPIGAFTPPVPMNFMDYTNGANDLLSENDMSSPSPPPIDSPPTSDSPSEFSSRSNFSSETEPEVSADIQSEPVRFNFFADPCCCCPIHWVNPDAVYEDLFSYG